MNDQRDEILTIGEVAAYLKSGKRTVYRLAANGKIPAFKLGGTWRFRRGELGQWIASRIDKAMSPFTRASLGLHDCVHKKAKRPTRKAT